MPVLTLFSMLAYQPNAFLTFSLPLPSHHPFPSFLVVGPHRSLLSPGPLVSINQKSIAGDVSMERSYLTQAVTAQAVSDFLLLYDTSLFFFASQLIDLLWTGED